MRKTLLVTGGAGFIGSNFVHFMLRNRPEYDIIVLDCLAYAGSLDNLPDAVKQPDQSSGSAFRYGDICNADLVNALAAESDEIVHFAAESHVSRSIVDSWRCVQTNIIGSQTLVDAVRKGNGRVERMVHISSSEVYGEAVTPQMDEAHPLNPKSPYAGAKCGADRMVYAYCATYDLPVVTLRPFNTYGPRQHIEKLVPRFITHVLTGQALPLHGRGEAMRDFTHVDDLCRAVDLALHAPLEQVRGQVFNVASGTCRSVRGVAQDIARLMDADPGRVIQLPDRPGQVARQCGDFAKIHRTLGWSPTIGWDSGLRTVVDWYAQNPDSWRRQALFSTQPILQPDGRIALH